LIQRLIFTVTSSNYENVVQQFIEKYFSNFKGFLCLIEYCQHHHLTESL